MRPLKTWLRVLMIIAVLELSVFSFLVQWNGFLTEASGSASMPNNRPVVFIDPPKVTAFLGASITIAVKVFNLTNNWITLDPVKRIRHWIGNLYGFEIELLWDTAILNYTGHVLHIPRNATFPDGVLYEPILNPNVTINWRAGRFNLFVTSLSPAPAFNNPNENATIFEISFKVIGYGSSYIRLGKTELVAIYNEAYPTVSTEIYHHPKWPYPDFFSDAYHEYPGAPVAVFTTYPADYGVVNRTVEFNASGSYDTDGGSITLYMWDFGDGTKLNATVPVVYHNYTFPGEFIVTLMVLDNDSPARRSAPCQKTLIVSGRRDLVIEGYSCPDSIESAPYGIYMGLATNIQVAVRNKGEVFENFTLKAYYNGTDGWVEISNKSVSLRAGETKIFSLSWDFSVVGPHQPGYYMVRVNITSVIPFEDVTDNFAPRPPSVPPVVVRVTEQRIYDLAVKSIDVVVVGSGGISFPAPVLTGEKATINMVVGRLGSVYEAFNAVFQVVHPNGTVLASKSWSSQMLGAGNRSVSLVYTFATAGLANVDLNVSLYVVNSNPSLAELDINATNNAAVKSFRVVKPPKLRINKPASIYVNETVTFDASESVHEGGSIVKYRWEIYANLTLLFALSGESTEPVWSVTFRKVGTGYRVVLTVTDEYGITYHENRPASDAYRTHTIFLVQARGEETPWKLSQELLLAFVVLAFIVVGSVVFLVFRRRRAVVENIE